MVSLGLHGNGRIRPSRRGSGLSWRRTSLGGDGRPDAYGRCERRDRSGCAARRCGGGADPETLELGHGRSRVSTSVRWQYGQCHRPRAVEDYPRVHRCDAVMLPSAGSVRPRTDDPIEHESRPCASRGRCAPRRLASRAPLLSVAPACHLAGVMPPRAGSSDAPWSFVEGARRAQIVQCMIEIIASLGYAQASLASIAERAGISKGVMGYLLGHAATVSACPRPRSRARVSAVAGGHVAIHDGAAEPGDLQREHQLVKRFELDGRCRPARAAAVNVPSL